MAGTTYIAQQVHANYQFNLHDKPGIRLYAAQRVSIIKLSSGSAATLRYNLAGRNSMTACRQSAASLRQGVVQHVIAHDT
jgi:hypothetical protein